MHGILRGILHPEQRFEIAELSVLSGGVDLLHDRIALRVAEIRGKSHMPVVPVLHAGVVEIGQRTLARKWRVRCSRRSTADTRRRPNTRGRSRS